MSFDLNDDLAEAITHEASLGEIKRAALQDGWQTLRIMPWKNSNGHPVGLKNFQGLPAFQTPSRIGKAP